MHPTRGRTKPARHGGNLVNRRLHRWARTSRLIGLACLTTAAIAIAVAVLLFTIGAVIPTAVASLTAVALTAAAILEFVQAAKDARLTTERPTT